MRVVYWGTYDTGKPRNRIMIRGLKENGIEVLECHADVWGRIEDKSQVSGWSQRLRLLVRWLRSYPGLILHYLRLPKHDVVIIGYMGHLDVLILWPFAKLRGVPIVWDAFLSLYNTVVEDRKFIGPKHPSAYLLFTWEYLSCRAADIVILDTRAHADYFRQRFKIPENRIGVVFVGVETDAFPLRPQSAEMRKPNQPLSVLFYGQFIPLHGIETVVCAAKLTEEEQIRWILIGRGQEESKIRRMIEEKPLKNLTWIPWVPFNELSKWIQKADICLGIFGDTKKAAMVIPNKVFQILASGRPIVTMDSPAIRELLSPEMPGVYLVAPSDPDSLIGAIKLYQKNILNSSADYSNIQSIITPKNIGLMLTKIIEATLTHEAQKEKS